MIRNFKYDDRTAKSFDIITINLSILYYFNDNLGKLFSSLYLS